MYMCSTFRLNDPWCRLQGEGGQERGQLSAVGPGAGTQSFQRGLSASGFACSERLEETEKAFKAGGTNPMCPGKGRWHSCYLPDPLQEA